MTYKLFFISVAMAVPGCGRMPLPAPAPSSAPAPAAPSRDPKTVLDDDREVGSAHALRYSGDAAVAQLEKAASLLADGKTAEAMLAYYELLPLEVPPLGEDELPDYNSVPHKAALALSSIYEGLGEPEKALKYVLLARDKYLFYDPCGTCIKVAEHHMKERVARLEGKVSDGKK